MMNAARFGVGMQGVAIADRAYQKAAAYARERVQSRAVEGSAGPVAIIEHPDVRRMLMFMRSHTEAARAVAYVAAAGPTSRTITRTPNDGSRRRRSTSTWCRSSRGGRRRCRSTWPPTAFRCTAAWASSRRPARRSFYRDARILTIYEGTTAIQANDLVGRKTARDGGSVARALGAQMKNTAAELSGSADADLAAIGRRLAAAADAYIDVVDYVVSRMKGDIRSVFAGSVPYLKLAGIVHGAWQLARAAAASARLLELGSDDPAFHRAKVTTARFFADHVLTAAGGLRDSIVDGSTGVLGLSAEQF